MELKKGRVGKYKLELFKLKLPTGDFDGPPITLIHNQSKSEVFHFVTTTEHHEVVKQINAREWLKYKTECYVAGYVDEDGIFHMRPDLTTDRDQEGW